MNIVDQIISAIHYKCNVYKTDTLKKTKSYSGENRIGYYRKELEYLSLSVAEKKRHTRLAISDDLSYYLYKDLKTLCEITFYPLDVLIPIIFEETEKGSPDRNKIHVPKVNKGFDFAWYTSNGREIANYLADLHNINWIKQLLEEDIQIPDLINWNIFKLGNSIFIYKVDYLSSKRLYIKKCADDILSKTYSEILYLQAKNNRELSDILKDTPFLDGQEAQIVFDINWYRHSKISPLTYSCFSHRKTKVILPNPNHEECEHSGLYCINKKQLDNRFARFLNVYNALDQESKAMLLRKSIEDFENYLNKDEFENEIHSHNYKKILQNLKSLNPDSLSLKEDLFIIRLSTALSRLTIDDRKLHMDEIKAQSEKRFYQVDLLYFTKQNESTNIIKSCSPVITPYLKMYLNELIQNTNGSIIKYYETYYSFLFNEFKTQVNTVVKTIESVKEIEKINDTLCIQYLERIAVGDSKKYYEFLNCINIVTDHRYLPRPSHSVNGSNDKSISENYISANYDNGLQYSLELTEKHTERKLEKLGQGFCVYLIWSYEKKSIDISFFEPSKEIFNSEFKSGIFNKYFIPRLEEKKLVSPLEEINIKNFVSNHLAAETLNFKKLKNLQNYHFPIPVKTLKKCLIDYSNYLKSEYQIEFESNKNESKIKKKEVVNEIDKNQTVKVAYPNLHLKIFIDNGFELFDYLWKNIIAKDNKYNKRDISFIYQKMANNELIHPHQARFIKWILEEYDFDLGQIVSFYKCNAPHRETIFNQALEILKKAKD